MSKVIIEKKDKEKILFNSVDPDISDSSISSSVTLRENALSEALVVANDEEGAIYLSTLHLYDTVSIYYDYEEDNPDWDTLEPIFKGWIIEFTPSLTVSGQVASVIAMNGLGLKMMRVASVYGNNASYTSYNDSLFVNAYDNTINQFGKQGSTPYLDNDADSDIFMIMDSNNTTLKCNGWTLIHNDWTYANGTENEVLTEPDDNKYMSITGASEGGYAEYFTFEQLNTSLHIHNVQLKAHMKVLSRSESVKVTLYLWNGNAWEGNLAVAVFNNVDYDWFNFTINGVFNTQELINGLRMKVEYTDDYGDTSGAVYVDCVKLEVELTKEGYNDSWYMFQSIEENDYFNLTTFQLELYTSKYGFWTGGNPTVAYVTIDINDGTTTHYLSPKEVVDGDWLIWNVNGVLDPTKFNSYKARITFYSVTGVVQGTFYLIKLCFYINGYSWSGTFTPDLRSILTDSEHGIIPRYVEKILDTDDNSGYILDTDYVYNDTLQYTYLNFPYQDAFMCIQDLIRLGSATHYIDNPDNWRGLHWIVQYDKVLNKHLLLIAPVGYHEVDGKNSSCNISDKWNTYASDTPIVVRQDMITQQFKAEVPLANYVLVAGKFILPIDEQWTELPVDWIAETGIMGNASITMDSSYKHDGNYSLKLHLAVPIELTGSFKHPLNVDLTKLITRNNDVTLRFMFSSGTNTKDWKLRLYTTDSYADKFFEYVLTLNENNKFVEFNIPITYSDINGNNDSKWIYYNVTNDDWDSIKHIGFIFTGAIGSTACWIDGLAIIGNVIRGIYTSDCGENSKENCTLGCIKHYGCRFLTIKDSLASTDTLNANDTDSSLVQLAIYELLRSRVIRITGQVTIPLEPNIKAGQLIHIHACYDSNYTDGENTHYRINKDFRITEVKHNYNVRGATTAFTLTDDTKNSIPIDTTDPYTIVMRVINPDYQTRTCGSLKITGGDFDAYAKPITADTKILFGIGN